MTNIAGGSPFPPIGSGPAPSPPPLGETPGFLVPGAESRKNWIGIVALVLGCVGGSVIGLALGFRAVRAVEEGEANNRRLAIASVVVNSAMIVITGIAVAILASTSPSAGA